MTTKPWEVVVVWRELKPNTFEFYKEFKRTQYRWKWLATLASKPTFSYHHDDKMFIRKAVFPTGTPTEVVLAAFNDC